MCACVLVVVCLQINFLLLISRQGKTRLTKWYQTYSAKVRRDERRWVGERTEEHRSANNNATHTTKEYVAIAHAASALTVALSVIVCVSLSLNIQKGSDRAFRVHAAMCSIFVVLLHSSHLTKYVPGT